MADDYKPETNDKGILDAVLHGVGKGASFGLSDRLQALLGAVGSQFGGPDIAEQQDKQRKALHERYVMDPKLTPEQRAKNINMLENLYKSSPDEKPKSFGDVYDSALKEARIEEDARAKNNPIAYTTGDVAGSVLSSLLMPGAKGVTATQGAGAQMARSAAQAAAQGAAQGAGRSRGDIGDILKDAAKGAAVSGLIGAATPGVGALINKIPGAGRTAGQKAVEELGKDAVPKSKVADVLGEYAKDIGATADEAAKLTLNDLPGKVAYAAENALPEAAKQAAMSAKEAAQLRLMKLAELGLKAGGGAGIGALAKGTPGAVAGAIGVPLALSGGKLILKQGPEFLTSVGSKATGAAAAPFVEGEHPLPPEPKFTPPSVIQEHAGEHPTIRAEDEIPEVK